MERIRVKNEKQKYGQKTSTPPSEKVHLSYKSAQEHVLNFIEF
jgi:hypothetical protein